MGRESNPFASCIHSSIFDCDFHHHSIFNIIHLYPDSSHLLWWQCSTAVLDWTMKDLHEHCGKILAYVFPVPKTRNGTWCLPWPQCAMLVGVLVHEHGTLRHNCQEQHLSRFPTWCSLFERCAKTPPMHQGLSHLGSPLPSKCRLSISVMWTSFGVRVGRHKDQRPPCLWMGPFDELWQRGHWAGRRWSLLSRWDGHLGLPHTSPCTVASLNDSFVPLLDHNLDRWLDSVWSWSYYGAACRWSSTFSWCGLALISGMPNEIAQPPNFTLTALTSKTICPCSM